MSPRSFLYPGSLLMQFNTEDKEMRWSARREVENQLACDFFVKKKDAMIRFNVKGWGVIEGLVRAFGEESNSVQINHGLLFHHEPSFGQSGFVLDTFSYVDAFREVFCTNKNLGFNYRYRYKIGGSRFSNETSLWGWKPNCGAMVLVEKPFLASQLTVGMDCQLRSLMSQETSCFVNTIARYSAPNISLSLNMHEGGTRFITSGLYRTKAIQTLHSGFAKGVTLEADGGWVFAGEIDNDVNQIDFVKLNRISLATKKSFAGNGSVVKGKFDLLRATGTDMMNISFAALAPVSSFLSIGVSVQASSPFLSVPNLQSSSFSLSLSFSE